MSPFSFLPYVLAPISQSLFPIALFLLPNPRTMLSLSGLPAARRQSPSWYDGRAQRPECQQAAGEAPGFPAQKGKGERRTILPALPPPTPEKTGRLTPKKKSCDLGRGMSEVRRSRSALVDAPDTAAMAPSRQTSLILFSGTGGAFAFTRKLQESKSTT